jgi:hypothetical protein
VPRVALDRWHELQRLHEQLLDDLPSLRDVPTQEATPLRQPVTKIALERHSVNGR